jgi:hypothetical protein
LVPYPFTFTGSTKQKNFFIKRKYFAQQNMAQMGVVSDPPRGLRVEDLRGKPELVSSNPNSPFVKDGYRSEDMHDTEVNSHIEDLMSFASNMTDTPGQDTQEEENSGDEEFRVSDGQGGFVVNLSTTFEATENSSSTNEKKYPSPRLAKLTELKAARDRERRRQEEEEEAAGGFWSWCCASSRSETCGGSSTKEHN